MIRILLFLTFWDCKNSFANSYIPIKRLLLDSRESYLNAHNRALIFNRLLLTVNFLAFLLAESALLANALRL